MRVNRAGALYQKMLREIFMKIISNKVKLELDENESWSIAWHIKCSLEHKILSHYIKKHHDSSNRGLECHAKPLFEEQCRKDLNIMNALLACSEGDTRNRFEKELWYFLESEYKKEHNNPQADD